MSAPTRPVPARLAPDDVVRVGAAGLRTRPLRIVLSALGIAIGIAAMLAVVGISASSRAELDRTLRALGTNLLTVAPGNTLAGAQAKLPPESTAMVRRIGPVQSVTATGRLAAKVYRNEHIPAGQNGSISVLAARADLLEHVGARLTAGRWLTEGADGPTVVLGAGAALRLGIDSPGPRVWLGGRWFSVVGILAPIPLAPELDSAALVGWPAAQRLLDFDGSPTTIYTRTTDASVEQVRAVLAATVNPQAPNEVKVSRPSDALSAARVAGNTLNGMLLGLGAVALIVGGVGVANTMVISVLERRAEIGLRRALGATRGQIRLQFLCESLLLATLGGGAGVLFGSIATAGYAWYRTWPAVIPGWALMGGLAATITVGAVAGLYPAAAAARLAPTEALTH
ncbi:putative ABC transport system permease protein [Actinoplanes campanulatus]|uniref:Putative ABC transport system permease protein n=1 Tax=Actinoplanes campanulatus TaxID=113559 RepID=A0A7W5AE31_9ACTN|nr:ABC transporter permease [Actinoplanes campanulatus]MBB3094340.1 putative ABC transport system permease protein [Actinoplanes campanulatus]GGN20340.1 ABC transporter permease [Actinoplanes campanulatus]GID35742.1 ABC transporter permease [Actinoplanes campanulatus]